MHAFVDWHDDTTMLAFHLISLRLQFIKSSLPNDDVCLQFLLLLLFLVVVVLLFLYFGLLLLTFSCERTVMLLTYYPISWGLHCQLQR
jgi:hypothetical protein